MDAEADEDAELSPSAVVRSTRSRDDDAMGCCVSVVSEAGAAGGRVVESCLLRPFCACET